MQCIVVKDPSVVVISGVECEENILNARFFRLPTDIDDLIVSNDLNMGLKHSFFGWGQPFLLRRQLLFLDECNSQIT